MNYYDVLVASKSKINQLLTYTSSENISPYQIVQVPVRQQLAKGIIVKSTTIEADLKDKYRSIKTVTPFSLPKTLVKAGLKLSDQSALPLSGLANLLLSNACLDIVNKPNAKYLHKDTTSPIKLSQAQQTVYKALKQYKLSSPQLLFGVNGAGKTRIYAELIKDQIKNNKSALILVPEIGLSGQVVELLTTYLKDVKIYLFHSQLTPKQRKSLWQLCQQSDQALVVIGPRSAEFLPFSDLGLIILDEFHDDSYKQNTHPSYHSLQFAHCLSITHKAKLICGTATPKIEDYYYFKQAKYPIIELNERAISKSSKPEIIIVDKKPFEIFHQTTLQAISKSLEKKHQVLVFYNRRGDWRIIQCSECHWQACCPNCGQNLVLHQDKFKLICHRCSHQTKPLSACLKCRASLNYDFIGIKAVVSQLENYLIKSNLKSPILRFDSDNPKAQSLINRLEQINTQKDLIIIGTQIINQGLDLTNLQTVVVLDAEQNIVGADYRAGEKYYQQIHQISGRVGRGHLKQTYIVVQTTNPHNPITKQALNQDWLDFYDQELDQRRQFNLPPFMHFANINIRRTTKASSLEVANSLYQELCSSYKDIKFYKPSPSMHPQHKKYWEYLIHASSRRRSQLLVLANDFKNREHFINLDPSQLFDS